MRLLQGWQGYLMTDGYKGYRDLPIDNNPCANAIRPFVIGRQN